MKVREQAGASIPLWPAPIPAAYDSRSRGPGMHQIPPCSPFLLFNNAVATATAFFTGATEGAENGIGWSSFVRTDVASGGHVAHAAVFSSLIARIASHADALRSRSSRLPR